MFENSYFGFQQYNFHLTIQDHMYRHNRQLHRYRQYYHDCYSVLLWYNLRVGIKNEKSKNFEDFKLNHLVIENNRHHSKFQNIHSHIHRFYRYLWLYHYHYNQQPQHKLTSNIFKSEITDSRKENFKFLEINFKNEIVRLNNFRKYRLSKWKILSFLFRNK